MDITAVNNTFQYDVNTNNNDKVTTGDIIKLIDTVNNTNTIKKVYNSTDNEFKIYDGSVVDTNNYSYNKFIKQNYKLLFNVEKSTDILINNLSEINNTTEETIFTIPNDNIYVFNLTITYDLTDGSDISKLYVNLNNSYIKKLKSLPITDIENESYTVNYSFKLNLKKNDIIKFESNYKLKSGDLNLSVENGNIFSQLESNIYYDIGNVGIGNTNPIYKLDVNGDINFNGTLRQNGNIFTSYSDADTLQLLNSGISNGIKINTGNLIVTDNVGIGTTNPTSKLHIPSNSSSTVNLLNFKNQDDYGIYVDSTGISSRGNTLDFKTRDYNFNNITIHDLLTLRPEGNVGIGTTNPTEKLDIQNGNIILSGSYNAYTYVGDSNWGTGVFNSGSTYYNEIKGYWGDGNNRGFRLFNSFNNTIPLFVNSNGNVGIGTTNPTEYLSITGQNSGNKPSLGLHNGNSNTTFNNGAQIAFGYSGTNRYQHFIHTRHNSANADNAIDFYTSDGTQNNTVTSGSIHTMSLVSGNVGIGTSNPSYKLDVIGGLTRIDNCFVGRGYNIYDYCQFRHQSLTSHDDYALLQWNGGETYLNAKSGTAIGFRLGNQEKMRLVSNGNVGIGTTNPTQKLDVRGNMRLGDGTTAEQDIVYYNNTGNWQVGLNNSGNGTSGNQFYIYDNAYRLTVQKGTGNVGIGTNNPAEKLDVSGKVSCSDLVKQGHTYTQSLIKSYHFYATGHPTSWEIPTLKGNCIVHVAINNSYGTFWGYGLSPGTYNGSFGYNYNHGLSYYIPYFTAQGSSTGRWKGWIYNANNAKVQVTEIWF